MPFVKLDKGILTSTIWCLRPELEVFVTALLMAEPREFTEPIPTLKITSLEDGEWTVPAGWYGFVHAAGPGIVRASHVDQSLGMEALKRLAAPEPESRSQEFDGRRMVRVNGGFTVLNFMKYRDFDHSAADRMRRLRERRKRNVTANVTDVRANVTHSREKIADSRKVEADNPIPAVKPLHESICDEIYAAYPRRVGRQAALKAIRAAMKVRAPADILAAVKAYAEAVEKWPASDRAQFVPHPATWFNRGSYDDDPQTWIRQESTQGRAAFA